jgi:hypothetical protein
LNKVRQDATKKFGGDNSYVKNLWVLNEYKKRGGKVSYQGKKPSGKKIQKQIGSFDINDSIIDMIDEWEEESDEAFEKRMYAECDDDSKEEIFAADKDKIAEVYQKYHSLVNMSYSQLKKWSENPCSKAASLSRGPINRNLRLLSKSKDEWTAADVSSANRTISFISRMRGAEQGEKVKGPDGQSCPSKRDISLMNWAYNS